MEENPPQNPADPARRAFATLGPDAILDAVESLGYRCDGHLLALNSYENRVYQVGIEDRPPLVAKFYRPGRWSDAAILEEHRFSAALAELEIPVVAPLGLEPTVEPTIQATAEASAEVSVARDGTTTLFHHGLHRFALYPRRGGRAPELDNPDHLEQLGRFLGRIHNLGEAAPFRHRPELDIQSFGIDSYRFVLESGMLPRELELPYRTLAEDVIVRIEARFAESAPYRRIRLHGDCHPGNILWTDAGPHIVDFDDARNGPSMQDLWMFLSGDRAYAQQRLMDLLEGYTEFRPFEPRELHMAEALRTLRILHHAAWIARRWEDPAFPIAFPWFNQPRFWEEQILSLREQAALLEEPPLVWD